MTGTELIAHILKLEGIDMVTCFPSNALIESVAKEGIRPVMFRHERGAIMAADGFSRVNDRKKFGVALMQHAAGAENSVGAISQAFSDNVPILVLPGGHPIEQKYVRPNFSAVDNYKNIVKSAETIYTTTQISDIMRRAFHALKNGPPGPVVVEMSIDICEKEVPSNEEVSMKFLANATGRFVITSHSSHGIGKEGHAKLFESDSLLPGNIFEYVVPSDMKDMTITYQNRLHLIKILE